MLRVRSLITPTCHQHHHYKHCWPRDLQPTEEIAKRLQCVVFHLYLWHCHPDVHSSGTNCEWLCWPFKLSMNQASLLASGGYNSMCPKKITSILPGKLYEQNMARLRWRVWSHSWNLLRQGWRKRFSPSWTSSWNHFVWSRFRGNMSICQIHHLQNPEITLFDEDSEELKCSGDRSARVLWDGREESSRDSAVGGEGAASHEDDPSRFSYCVLLALPWDKKWKSKYR